MKSKEELAKEHADKVYEDTPGFPSDKEWPSIKAHYAFLAGYEACEKRVEGLVKCLESFIRCIDEFHECEEAEDCETCCLRLDCIDALATYRSENERG